MIIFFYGRDTFRSRVTLTKAKKKFRGEKDPHGYNIAHIDCLAEKNPARIFQEMFAAPFLAPRRFVVIESLLSSKHADARKELIRRMEQKQIPEDNVLVFWEGTDSWKTKDATALAELLKKEKFSQAFDILLGQRLYTWIKALVAESGGSISDGAVREISQRIGADSWHIHSCVDQLIAYADGKMIAERDIDLFLDHRVDNSVFTLVDAAIAGKLKDAFAMIREQYRIGEDVQFIFAMLLRQLRILIEIRGLLDRSSSLASDRIATDLKLHPFVVKKSLPMAKRHAMGDLLRAYRALLDFDVGIKKGLGTPETLLDVFVARFSFFPQRASFVS